MYTVVAPWWCLIFTVWSLNMLCSLTWSWRRQKNSSFLLLFDFTWVCLLFSILYSLSSCRSFVRLDLRRSFLDICLLESFWFFSFFLGPFSTYSRHPLSRTPKGAAKKLQIVNVRDSEKEKKNWYFTYSKIH